MSVEGIGGGGGGGTELMNGSGFCANGGIPPIANGGIIDGGCMGPANGGPPNGGTLFGPGP